MHAENWARSPVRALLWSALFEGWLAFLHGFSGTTSVAALVPLSYPWEQITAAQDM